MPKRWRIRPHDAALVAALERSVGVSAIVARLLAARGLSDAAAAKTFLAGTLQDFSDATYDWSRVTEFQRAVYRQTLLVKPGYFREPRRRPALDGRYSSAGYSLTRAVVMSNI